MISQFRILYRRFVHFPALDHAIYAALDFLTDAFARAVRFSFPENYIRRWKLNMLSGLYEPETYKLFKHTIMPGETIVDIGAHIGYFTRLFSRLAGRDGRVFAFEADPTNFVLLARNTRGYKNVRIAQIAITDRIGIIDFYHYDDKSGAHSTLPNVPLDFVKRKITVGSTTLDSWLLKNSVSKVDVIKMDIEGGESAALLGMKDALKGARVLVTEFAPAWIAAAGSTPLAFLKNIEKHEFEISAVTSGGLVKLSPVKDDSFLTLLPKTRSGSHASEFINLYCVKK
ncbi:MAG: hypothetical protein A2W52_01105 [Candidatus Taylorbacteria bacterium RIFCSPHIGHO2_02_49_25]|uniref:Methyltransferase FkbM domain-containing protein n=1 Tax=Candidatus Taylorbacteria bacterium RIFCSPHIGHO2_02_49_25 TaxID=1802305 RepID=A0A1G2MD87_9BACT|nr:MAG: Methyltransferase FkbM family [Parcubacteria group bacterium GW2011_GWF2_50_9]OHA19190.1 MAG: hypothetical protein A2759_00675 [Candidatus Taylorbacteria bacterium RIFCSPHIGHO2_01_FULL_49_60]OHA20981.1 MAG: hypothetical protein A2W52_01105 [Candidatus Taylorbacteria bacterium RIFCSPHIGHO2_02_49_25]OHA35960.1 MAG: hypothetical protein A3B27_02420 [Candidatus Taylorbacteria bacterium RIFCSPLOWO2_01_FULL_50_130]OHA37280.1 MAG: hypothetical protein A2W65_03350 [Candidatus Taylorbacteria bac